ncbi:acrosin-binding protein isoform X1 [Pelobates fuscus]|uniref:acrosin-binding protein isoform X1 n=1 Tax=Pelobates fuscus TaxID=191477 RepID=UPI002FE4B775
MRSLETRLCFLYVCVIFHRAEVSMQSVDLNQHPKLGSPLSDNEYKEFWELFNPDWKAEELCEFRENFGCNEPRVLRIDLFENHGQIPDGMICTELDTIPPFDSFCSFAKFRCAHRQFFLKRIPCQDSQTLKDFHALTPGAKSYVIDEEGLIHAHIVKLIQLSIKLSGEDTYLKDANKADRSLAKRSVSKYPSSWPSVPQSTFYKDQQRKSPLASLKVVNLIKKPKS